jgi:hypothetical protein
MEQFCPPDGHQCPLYPVPDGRAGWRSGYGEGCARPLAMELDVGNIGNLRNRGASDAVLQE